MNTENKNMRLYEIDDSRLKKRIKNAIDKLDDSRPEDEKMLQYLKSNLFVNNIQTALDTSSLKSKVRAVAYDWFVSKLETLKVPVEDKVHLLKLMSNDANLIPADTFKQNIQGNILTYVSNRIKSNRAFKEIATPIWQFKIGGQGGMGPGELFMILFSEQAKEGGKKGGDFSVANWLIELKKEGVVPPGDSGKRVVDKLNKELVDRAKQEGFFNELKKSRTSFDGGWLPTFFKIYSQTKGEKVAKQLFTHYLTTLYEGIPTTIINSAFANLGNPGTEQLVAPYIFQMYKDSHQWDSICLVDENLHFVNLISFENIPPEVRVKISLKRNKDTNAVADGYLVAQLGGASASDIPADTTGAVKKPKSKTKPNVIKSTQQDLPLDNADATQDIEHKQSLIQAEKDLAIKLQDPVNPIKQVWDTVATDVKSDAHDDILSAISAGKSDQEVAQVLKDYVYEHSLKRMKQLFN